MARLRVGEELEKRGMSAADLYRAIILKFGEDGGKEVSYNTILTLIRDPGYRPNMRKLEVIAETLGIRLTDLIED